MVLTKLTLGVCLFINTKNLTRTLKMHISMMAMHSIIPLSNQRHSSLEIQVYFTDAFLLINFMESVLLTVCCLSLVVYCLITTACPQSIGILVCTLPLQFYMTTSP